MNFKFKNQDNLIKGIHSYNVDDKSIDFSNVNTNKDGQGSFTIIASHTLQIDLDITNMQINHCWGYLPQEAWLINKKDTLSLTEYIRAEIYLVKDNNFEYLPSVSYESDLYGLKPMYYVKSKTIVVGTVMRDNIILQITEDFFVVLDGSKLAAIVIRFNDSITLY